MTTAAQILFGTRTDDGANDISVKNTVRVSGISVWNKLPTGVDHVNSNSCNSLEEVMSEQLATHLQEKETSKLAFKYNHDDVDDYDYIKNHELEEAKAVVSSQQLATTNLDSDLILAQLLQLEFDKEFDELINSKEKLTNKNSRVSISYDKFKSVHPLDIKQENELNELNRQELTSSSESEDELEKITFKRGVSGKGENMISKHDILLTSRQNGSKMSNTFPADFETGDTHGIDLRLSNKVYNALKLHSLSDGKRHNRLADKQDKSTNVMSLDPKTRLILFKLVNSDILESIGGVISTGKEATIFYAPGGNCQEFKVPKECVAKVFKTTLNEFKTREKYIGDDYRFKDRYKHLNPQKIVKLWAEKEMHNLMKMRKFDIPCPEVVALKKHVLIMSFIGTESQPAPKLKDANLNEQELKEAYMQCIQLIKDLYNRCNLVHADFNQFNLLWHENRVWCIDVSQSVEPIHPLGYEFLLRDCQNIFKFFSNRKLEDIKTGEQIFNQVTGFNFQGEGDYFLSQIQKYSKEKKLELNAFLNRDTEDDQSNNTPKQAAYNFDYYYEMSLKNQSSYTDDNELNN